MAMIDNRTTELESLSKLKMAGRLRYWRGTIEIPEDELHAICDEIQAEHEQAIAATLGSGTCKLVEEHVGITDSWPYHIKCNSCGAVFDYFDCYYKTGRIGLTMKHCKQCGRKVVSE